MKSRPLTMAAARFLARKRLVAANKLPRDPLLLRIERRLAWFGRLLRRLP